MTRSMRLWVVVVDRYGYGRWPLATCVGGVVELFWRERLFLQALTDRPRFFKKVRIGALVRILLFFSVEGIVWYSPY